MVKSKELRREEPLSPVAEEEPPFSVPDNWKWVRVGDLALFTQYGTSAKAAQSDDGVPVLTMGNIQGGAIIRKNEKRLPKTSNEFPSLYLKKFDLLYNRTNSAELVGKTGLYLGEDDCLTFASYLIRIKAQFRAHITVLRQSGDERTRFSGDADCPVYQEADWAS